MEYTSIVVATCSGQVVERRIQIAGEAPIVHDDPMAFLMQQLKAKKATQQVGAFKA